MKVLLFLSIIVLATANLQLKNDWEAWKREHGKAYADDLEESLRHAIWFQNFHYVEEHNKRESFKLSLNAFADLVGFSSCTILHYPLLILSSIPFTDKRTVYPEVSLSSECRISPSVCH